MDKILSLLEIPQKCVSSLGNLEAGSSLRVFIKNPNNNPGNYCKSLFLKTAQQMAGPLNPDCLTQ